MSSIFEERSDAPASSGIVVLLFAVPLIALTLMATLALQHDLPHGQAVSQTAAQSAASATSSSPKGLYDGDFTLYIMDSANAAQELAELGATVPLPAWFAYANTLAEEGELLRAREHADWIRNASGLPPVRVVDLRPVLAEPHLSPVP